MGSFYLILSGTVHKYCTIAFEILLGWHFDGVFVLLLDEIGSLPGVHLVLHIRDRRPSP